MKPKAPHANCEDCPLRDNEVVRSRWDSRDPSVVYVGEAPGYHEVRKGKPFVGYSGQLLDMTLSEHGADTSNAMLTNVVLCRPEGNATPTDKAIECCAPRLDAELSKAAPSTVVALGKTAAQRIIGKKLAITRERIGPPKHIKGKPYKVIPTIHPAACLRNPNLFNYFASDIKKLVSPIQVTWRPPDYKAFDSPTQARAAIAQIKALDTNRLVIDIETGFEKDDDLEHPRNLLCIGLGYAQSKVAIITRSALASPLVLSDLADLLSSSNVVAHNAKFDLGTLHRMGIGTFSVYFDTMLASYAVDETPGRHSLSELAQDFLGAPNWKQKVKKEGFLYAYENDREEFLKYNAYDVHCTWDLMDYYLDEMDSDDRRVHDMLCMWSDRIMLMESEGVFIDLAALDALEERMTVEIEEQLQAMQKYLPMAGELEASPIFKASDAARLIDNNDGIFNPNSHQQVGGLLCYYKNATITTTDKDMLNYLKDDKDTMVAGLATDMLVWRKVTKLYGTYVKGTKNSLSEDGRIRTTYKEHGTETGRLSSANPNVQNVPRQGGIREIYAAEPGNTFVYADYSNIEGRIVCVLAQDEDMREVLSDPNRDIHGEIADMIFGSNFTKEDRVKAKTVVHGKNYDRQPEGIAGDPELGLSLKEAKVISDTYDKRFKRVKPWQAAIKHQVLHTDEPLITPFGRKRRFTLITRDNQEDIYKEALAFKPQSIGSDICMNAAMRMWDVGLKVRILIHDGIIVECKVSETEHTKRLMKQIMESTATELFSDYVPWPVDVETGANWGSLS